MAGDSRLLTWELDPILGHGALFFSPLLADLTGHLLEEEEGPGGGLPCNHGNGSVALVAHPAAFAFLTGQSVLHLLHFPSL